MAVTSPLDASLRLFTLQSAILNYPEYSKACAAVRQFAKEENYDWHTLERSTLEPVSVLKDLIADHFDDIRLLRRIFQVTEPHLLFMLQIHVNRSQERLQEMSSEIKMIVPDALNEFYREFALYSLGNLE